MAPFKQLSPLTEYVSPNDNETHALNSAAKTRGLVNGNLHSTEVGSCIACTELSVQLALLFSSAPDIHETHRFSSLKIFPLSHTPTLEAHRRRRFFSQSKMDFHDSQNSQSRVLCF